MVFFAAAGRACPRSSPVTSQDGLQTDPLGAGKRSPLERGSEMSFYASVGAANEQAGAAGANSFQQHKQCALRPDEGPCARVLAAVPHPSGNVVDVPRARFRISTTRNPSKPAWLGAALATAAAHPHAGPHISSTRRARPLKKEPAATGRKDDGRPQAPVPGSGNSCTRCPSGRRSTGPNHFDGYAELVSRSRRTS